MSWTAIAADALHGLANWLAPAPSAPAAAAPAIVAPKPGLASALTAFVNFAGPFVRIVEGKGTLADDEAAANAVMDAIALFDPAAAPVVDLIEDFEPAATMLVGFVQTSGVKVTGGYRPELSGFAGARGHIE